MRTIRKWFEDLGENSERAIQNAKDQMEINLDIKVPTLEMAMLMGFSWEDSPEKGKYWEEIFHNLK